MPLKSTTSFCGGVARKLSLVKILILDNITPNQERRSWVDSGTCPAQHLETMGHLGLMVRPIFRSQCLGIYSSNITKFFRLFIFILIKCKITIICYIVISVKSTSIYQNVYTT